MLLFLLSVLGWYSPPSVDLADQNSTTSVEIYNVTEAAVEIWVNDAFHGIVPPKSMAARKVGREKNVKQIAITGISEGQDEYRLNAIVFALGTESDITVVWGGVTRPASNEEAPAGVAALAKNLGLFSERWKTLKAHVAGAPFNMEDTLIGTTWEGRAVRAEALSIHSARSSSLANSVGMLLVLIPKAQFNMSQVGGPAGRSVTLTRSFYMAVTETTRAQWSLMAEEHRELKSIDGQLPAVMLTWSQAQEYCAKLSDVPGWTYRLPTEAQWEYACSGGNAGPFHPVGVRVSRLMWYSGNSGMKVHPVGQLLPNQFGIYDMHGNVREWCRDWWGRFPPAGVDPVGPANGWDRVRRGGAYDVPEQWCSCGSRDGGAPEISHPWQGFRVVLEPD